MSRLRMSVLVVVTGASLALGTVPSTAGPQSADRMAAKAPFRGEAKQGLSDQRLQRVVVRAQAGRRVSPAVARISAGRVRVEVVGRTPRSVTSAVRLAGGLVLGQIRSLVLADVPLSRLQALEDRDDVLYVRLPQRVDEPAGDAMAGGLGAGPAAFAKAGSRGTEVVTKTKADAWHAAGFNGSGVKIGIIDTFVLSKWQAAMAAGEIAAMPAGTFCRNNGTDCSAQFWNIGDHGVAVAEVLTDMAPGATLYAATAVTTTDLKAAVDYFKSQGVRIISRSQTALYDGPGNGTGPLADVMAYAVSQGITWINSAGNSGGFGTDPGTYFRQTWWDPNGNGWMDFGTVGNEYLAFTCSGRLINGLRWSDWAAGGRTDYDIEVYEHESDATKIYQSVADQSAGAPPLETALNCTSGDDLDYMSVKLFAGGAGTTGDLLEFMTNDVGVELWSNPYSVTGPAADTKTPGTASVGAVDPPLGTSIATYSAQGPTNDERISPDLSAPAGMTNLTYGTFDGTSSATPAVAGAAAVMLSANPALAPAQLVDNVRAAVVDRGTAGPDVVYGMGELTMPAPPVGVAPPPAAGVTVTSAFAAPVARTLKGKIPVQVRWKTSGTQSQASIWRSLNGRPYTQGTIVGTEHKARLKMVLGKTNRFAVRAFDPAGTASDWRYTRAYRPRVVDDRDQKVHYGRGWRHFRQQGAWKGTLSSSQRAQGSVRLRFKGSAVSLAVFRSANSGKIRVYIDGKPKVKLNLRASKVQARRVVLNYAFTTRGRHTIEIEPLTSGPKGLVFIDGFLVLG